jgi:hypothetical protein
MLFENYSNMIINFFQLMLFFLTQIGTGPGNCGPASTAMVLTRYGYETSVEEVRNIIGYQYEDGGMSTYEIEEVLHRYDIPYLFTEDIQENSILLIDTTGLSNKKYYYNTRHYIYVLYQQGDYYICHDPMGGPNQIYLTEELEACKIQNIRITKLLPFEQWTKETVWVYGQSTRSPPINR